MKELLLLAIVVFCSLGYAHAQSKPAAPAPADTLKRVDILSADRYGFKKNDSLSETLVLVGKVKLRQDHTLFYADSAIYNRNTKIIEAFGNVHINDNDTTDIYSDYLLYHVDTKMANLKKKVRLTDSKSNLYTEDLVYDVNQQIGVYTNGGKVVNGSSVLTSQEGTYYADLKDVYFKKDVNLKDPKYTLSSDSLLYNTTTQLATFIAKTYIIDSARRTILTSEGYYDLKNRNASFGKRPIIHDGATIIIANDIQTDDKTGINILTGNAVFKDTAQGIAVLANSILSNRNQGWFLATQKPLLILKQDNDSTFIAADTLYSGKISTLKKERDSLIAARKDSSQPKAEPLVRALKNESDSSLAFTETDSLLSKDGQLVNSLKKQSDSLFSVRKDSV
ncbi:MAG: OstA-like protein, partial [Flavitalea sp.]